jgi:hypothetical protein
VLGRLGKGAQGIVFKAEAPGGRLVAIKLLNTRLDKPGVDGERFMREVAAARRVAQFCTAQVLDANMDGEQPYIVSELVDGVSLQVVVQREGPRAGGALYRLAVGTVTALAAIHRAGIVHRDFKPSNVLIGSDGPRVIDFGIARALDSAMTISSGVVGTPAYMSPEQISAERVGPASDMFSWALTMVFAATGRPAFGQDSLPAVIYRVMNAEPDLSALPDDLRPIVQACLSKRAEERPTAAEVLFALLENQGEAAGLDDEVAMTTGSQLAAEESHPPALDSPAPTPPASGWAAPGSPAPIPAADGSGASAAAPQGSGPHAAGPHPAGPHAAGAGGAPPGGGWASPEGQAPAASGWASPDGPAASASPAASGWANPSGDAYARPRTPPAGPPAGHPASGPYVPPPQQPARPYVPPQQPDASHVPPQQLPPPYPPPPYPPPSQQRPGGHPQQPTGGRPQEEPYGPSAGSFVPPQPSPGRHVPPRPPQGGQYGPPYPLSMPPSSPAPGQTPPAGRAPGRSQPSGPGQDGPGQAESPARDDNDAFFRNIPVEPADGPKTRRKRAAMVAGTLVLALTLAGGVLYFGPKLFGTTAGPGGENVAQSTTSFTPSPTPTPTPTPTLTPTPTPTVVTSSPAPAQDRPEQQTVPVVGKQDGKSLKGHTRGVQTFTAVSVSDDTTWLVTGGQDGRVRLWDLAKHKSLATMKGHSQEVYAVAGAMKGKTPIAVSGGYDGSVRLWNLKTRKGKVLGWHGDAVYAVAVTKVGNKWMAVTGDANGYLRFWDLDKRKSTGKTIRAHREPVNWLSATHIGDRAIAFSASEDESVRMWDMAKRKQYGKTYKGHSKGVYAVAVGKVGGKTVVASGGKDGKIRMWDPKTGKTLGTMSGHKKIVYSLSFGTLADRTVLLSGGTDGTIRLWDPIARKALGKPVKAHKSGVYAVGIVRVEDRFSILSAGKDKLVRMWKIGDAASGS